MNIHESQVGQSGRPDQAERDTHRRQRQVQLAVRTGTIGPDVIDVANLYKETGCFTYDPGFTSTANCKSAITYIDGDKGELLYRGYPIDQLAENTNFLAVCYLLLYGELPTNAEFINFRKTITHHTMVHEQMTRFFTGYRRDAHPMAVMVGTVGALSSFYHDSTDINDPAQREVASHRMIAKMPTIAAMAYKYSIGQPFIYPRNDLDYTSNFLQMCFAVPCEPYIVNPVISRALDRIFILHADHEQNASTSTVRLAGSSGANPFACISSGIACLWGPAHGGANEAALNMLKEIGTVDRIPEFVKKAKDKIVGLPTDGLRPSRLQELRSARQGDAEDLSRGARRARTSKTIRCSRSRWSSSASRCRTITFIEKKLYPNIDFYSGITLRAMGFPVDMFTVLFAVARTVGWIAQWKEMIEDPEQRIGRPRQLYVGPPRRDFPAA